MEQEAYPITYGVLGLLAFWGPLSGYDLKRIFDHTLSPLWGAAQSQIYKELRPMKELGWVEMQREEQETRPDRKVYSITEQGYVALRQWQAQPPGIFQLRDELLLKVLFATFAAPGNIAQHLRASTNQLCHQIRHSNNIGPSHCLAVRSYGKRPPFPLGHSSASFSGFLSTRSFHP